MPEVQNKLNSHKMCVVVAVAAMAVSALVTYGVLSLRGPSGQPISAADSPPGQIARNESVYIFASFYAGGAGVELSVKQGEVNTVMPTACEMSFPYKAEWTGQNLTAGTPQPDLIPLLLSRELQPGTRLGNFEPPIFCNGSYIYRAEVLN